MGLIDRLHLIPRRLIADERGWFLKVLDGKEQGLPAHTGEIYLTQAEPGQARGNHYHPKTAEWFTLLAGRARLIVEDRFTGERREIALSAADPQTVFMPAELSHVFVNPADAAEPFLLLAYAENLYDPADTVPADLLGQAGA